MSGQIFPPCYPDALAFWYSVCHSPHSANREFARELPRLVFLQVVLFGVIKIFALKLSVFQICS